MSNRSQGAAILLVIAVSLVFHTFIAYQDIGVLARNGFLYDDSFYAFKIARNIAAGNGMTFDGIHPTTGFQPLYVFILVPVYFFSGDNLILPIYIALTFLAICTCLTTCLIYRISRRYAGFAASICAALIWSLSPIVARQSANGLETAFATFVIALSAFYYLERVRPVQGVPPLHRFLVLGLLLGVAVLSRIDGILLVLALLLDYLLLLRRRGVAAGKASPVLLIPAGIIILYGPWLLFNIIESGNALQDSGTATRYLSLAYAPYFHNGSGSLASSGPDIAFIWKHFIHSLKTMRALPPVHVIFHSIHKAGSIMNTRTLFDTLANTGGLALLVFAGFSMLKWRKDRARSGRLEIGFLILFCALLLLSYSTYIFGSFFFVRYYFPVYFVGSLVFAFLLQDLLDWFGRKSLSVRRIAITAAAIYSGFFIYFSWSQSFRSWPVYPFYDIAGWVDRNVGENETVGVLQCGTIGYFSGRKVINLDGKVNREALSALKDNNLPSYVETEDIDIIIDHCRILEIFLDLSPDEIEKSCTPIKSGPMGGPTGWISYRPESAGVN
ncbi:MAG: glycosyltransferase family 39 protein [Candidatus Krumholzibacteriales bacterium]